MNNLLNRLIGDKKDWKRMEARATELPTDYRTVYGEMKNYLWRFTTGDGMDIVAILRDILDLFETQAAAGRSVIEVTGTDLAAFCDARLPSSTTPTAPSSAPTSTRSPSSSREPGDASPTSPVASREGRRGRGCVLLGSKMSG